LIALLATPALAAAPIEGTWNARDEHGVVQFYVCGEAICGKLLNADQIRVNPAVTDLRNKDAALRGRPLKDLVFLTGFTGGPKDWRGGSVYNPEDGGTYHGRLTLLDPDTLKLEGCIIYPFCQTQVWHRVK
jgi:uncharacterized protein (DUF2147 family)